MLVYGHRSFPLAPARFLAAFAGRLNRLATVPAHDDLVALLVDVGETESAVADALQPELDADLPALEPWRAALGAAAAAVCASWSSNRTALGAALDELRSHVAVLRGTLQPAVVRARVAEGFAQYALFPEQYIVAAHRFAAEARPTSVVCVGLRSIGPALAAIVAATLRQSGIAATVRSVRPRGDAWDRRLALAPSLRHALADCRGAHFAIVDEGPGISGSSFASAADGLMALGVPPERIVLFPSWEAPAESLRSSRGRAAWTRHRRFAASFEETWLPQLGGGRALDDVSAGRWRALTPPGAEGTPPVQPQHERRKYVVRGDGSHGAPPSAVLKFAGLGRHGDAKRVRAEALAAAGFGPEPSAMRRGFLERPWMPGRMLDTLDGVAAASRVAEYLAFVRAAFATGQTAQVSDLAEMVRHNVAEDAQRAGGADTPAAVAAITPPASAFDAPEIAVDGRMLPQEWIESNGRLWKIDALDHHADDFLPGCRDIAWDVAGVLVEGDFDRAGRDLIVGEYTRRSGDRGIIDRLPFYTTAYAAYRLGYVTLAADLLGDTADGRAFRRAASRYRRSLAGRAARRG